MRRPAALSFTVMLALALGCSRDGALRPQANVIVAPPSAQAHAIAAPARTIAPVFPGARWEAVPVPEAEGYSSAGLASVHAFLQTLDTTAAIVILRGRVLLAYGDVRRVSYVASVRKSVLGMLFGEPVARAQIRLDATLADLGIDDVGGLTADEKRATVDDLLTTRSGVYHAASNPGDDLGVAPPRGSKRPGELFLYNNWDFNVLGTIFEQQTHESVYDALARRISVPIGMEDFRRDQQHEARDDAVSIHPAYHMFFSTRDMARLGYLMLRNGSWDGREIVPPAWIATLRAPTARAEDVRRHRSWGLGYGRLWWLFDDPAARAGGPLEDAYTAIGAFGQYITVIPKLDVVIAHKVVHLAHEDVGVPTYRRLVDLVVACRRVD
jgi:CubicO group peptidase (beta-lactamase class C family)